MLNTSTIRRNGNACAWTSGAAFTILSRIGAAKYPTGAMMPSEMPTAVRKA